MVTALRLKSASWTGLAGPLFVIILIFGLMAVVIDERTPSQIIGMAFFGIVLIAILFFLTGAPLGKGIVRFYLILRCELFVVEEQDLTGSGHDMGRLFRLAGSPVPT